MKCVRASDVEFILLNKHKNNKNNKNDTKKTNDTKTKYCQQSKTNIVKIKPVKRMVNITIRQLENLVMYKQKIEQLDVLLGTASTGHKLQGQTKKALIIVDFVYFIDNWIYVVLSRVETLKGIFLMQPINPKLIRPSNEYLMHHEDFFHNKERDQNEKFVNLFQQELADKNYQATKHQVSPDQSTNNNSISNQQLNSNQQAPINSNQYLSIK